MPSFRYKAVTRDGQLDEGELVADSVEAIIARLQQAGRIPIHAEEIRGARRVSSRPKALPGLKTKGRKPDVTSFTRALSVLLESGTPLDRSLDIMREVESSEPSIELIRDVQSAVRGGASLSDALDSQGALFSRFYISMVRAAELSGKLAEGLQRLTEYMASSQALRSKIVSALIYPAILLGVAGLSVIILLTAVVPQFRPMFEEMGAALPLPTQIVLAVSDFLAAYGWWLPLVLGLLYVLARKAWMAPAGRRRFDRWLLRVPIAGALARAVDTARLGRSIGTLLSNGVPVLKGLAIARETMSNTVMAEALDAAADDLREGGHLSRALLEAGEFPPLAMQLLKVGEESGRVDNMMLRVADIYDEEVELTIQRLLSMLEPIMIVGLGVVIAGIIVSVLVGIISINDLPM